MDPVREDGDHMSIARAHARAVTTGSTRPRGTGDVDGDPDSVCTSCRFRVDGHPAMTTSFRASLLFHLIEDHRETAISAAPPRPVITSGMCTSD